MMSEAKIEYETIQIWDSLLWIAGLGVETNRPELLAK